MAKNKKIVINEAVDKVMEKYGRFLYQTDDINMFLQIRDFVKKVASQEYDRGIALAQVIKNESLPEEEKAAQFQKVMDYNLEKLSSTLKINQSEIKEKTPKNWDKLKIKHDFTKEEKEKSEDEELDEMMALATSNPDLLEDLDEDSNKYQTQEDIFNDLLSKILEPLTKQHVYTALKENNPSTQTTPDNDPNPNPNTTTMQGKREKLIKNVVDNILESHMNGLTVDENFAREYLTHVVTQQFNQVANSIHLSKPNQNLSRKEWIDQTKLNLHNNIDKLRIKLADEMEKNAVEHENLIAQKESPDADEGYTLDLKQKALFLTDIIAPLAQIELLSELKESNLSLQEMTKEPTIIPRRAPPKLPIQSAFTENQAAASKAAKTARAQVRSPENMKKPQR